MISREIQWSQLPEWCQNGQRYRSHIGEEQYFQVSQHLEWADDALDNAICVHYNDGRDYEN